MSRIERRVENSDLNAFLLRDWELSSASEWFEAFRAFQEFSYISEKARLLDTEGVVMKGLAILQREGTPDECIQLADWALANIQRPSRPMLGLVHYNRTLALIARGPTARGLEYYLTVAKEHADKPLRSYFWILGIHILIALNPQTDSDIIPASDEVVRFMRELSAICYPNRKLPAVLIQSRGEGPPSWQDLHTILIRHYRKPKRR